AEHFLHNHHASVASLRLLFTFAPECRSASLRNQRSPSPEYPVDSGEIVISTHEGAQRILLELSLDECADFAGRLAVFCKEQQQQTEVIDSTSAHASNGS
ncbi:MAG: hypothetical protein WCF26_09520, partial [Candidatus Sulfotelmatobacter sp.]